MMRVPGVVKIDRYEIVEDYDQYPAFLSWNALKMAYNLIYRRSYWLPPIS